MKRHLEPAYHAMFVKVLNKEEKSAGGILLNVKDNNYREFEITALGPLAGKNKETGVLEQELKVGDRVLIHCFHDTAEIYWEGQTYMYCVDTDVKFIVREDK